jgi:signal transduction histidine kinase
LDSPELDTIDIHDAIVVEIADTGKGIEPDHLLRIFNPSFTTKGSGIGMGLCLSIAHQIVEQHRGKLDVDSTVGKGKVFKLSLPVMQPDKEMERQ